ncbi:MAG: hypothetical protein LQ350_006563 [Teloschistes chrysophthalmus]|nr:MAG: hypothetical protein LQ350_006563 [Niorma chrysophthalma]
MRTYTQILLCFPVVSDSQAIDVLKKATAKLLELVPGLAGQVKNHKADSPSSGTFHVVPYAHPDGSALRIKPLDTWRSYDDLRNAKAPASMLDGTFLAPMKGFPDRYTDTDVTPVFIVQANFIPGGLLLCFSGMHNLMDGNGLGAVVELFAILCRGEAVPTELLESANFDRTQLPVSLKPGQSPLPHPEVAPKEKKESKNSPPSTWSYFAVSASNLERLKFEGSLNSTSYISTNDVLTAFVWRVMTRARFPNLPPDPAKASLLLRATNGRRILDPPVSNSYLGNIITCSRNRFPVKTLFEAPLSDIVQAVRKETNRVTDNHIRSFATLIEKKPDRSKIVFDMDDPEADALISSWATLPVWQDFGEALGKPEFVRRPTGGPWRGVCYMMPRRPDGGMDLLISLSEEEMKRLREDEAVKAVAEFVG